MHLYNFPMIYVCYLFHLYIKNSLLNYYKHQLKKVKYFKFDYFGLIIINLFPGIFLMHS